VDPAAADGRESGIFMLEGDSYELLSAFSLREIIDAVKSADVVAVDAPLSLPAGRCCLEHDCSCSRYGHFRRADLELRRYGSVLPLTWRGMRELTMRGMKMAETLGSMGVKVIETHPRTADSVAGISGWMSRKLGIEDLEMSVHQRDALIGGAVAILYCRGDFIELGDPVEGTIILPSPGVEL